MADLHLPYGGGFVTVRSPQAQGVPIIEPQQPPALPNVAQSFIDAASYQPMGSAGLHQIARPDQKYTILVRGPQQLWMGQYELIPTILYYLTQLGIPQKNIAVLVGSAVEGRVEPPALDAVIHPNLRWDLERVVCHDPEARDLVDIGSTSGGISVQVSPWVVGRNVIVLDGVRPHGILGFTGGGYPLLQVCGCQTVKKVMRHAVRKDAPALAAGIAFGAFSENPMCNILSEIGAMVRPFFGVYTLPTSANTTCHIVCGSWWDGWVEACRQFYELLGTRVTAPVGAVLASGGGEPADHTFRSVISGLYHCMQVLQAGGSIFMAAQCAGGGPDELLAYLKDGGIQGLHRRLSTKGGTLDELLLLGIADCCGKYHVHLQTKLSISELAFAGIHTYRTMETMEIQVPFGQTSICLMPHAVTTHPY